MSTGSTGGRLASNQGWGEEKRKEKMIEDLLGHFILSQLLLCPFSGDRILPGGACTQASGVQFTSMAQELN